MYISFHAQKGFLKKKVATLCFFSKMGKMEKGPLYGGHFFNWRDICIYWSGWKVIRALFVALQLFSWHPRIYGYLRVWAYLYTIYIPGMAYVRAQVGVPPYGIPHWLCLGDYWDSNPNQRHHKPLC